MKQKRLPGIVAVEYAPADTVSVNAPSLIREGSVVSVSGNFQTICITGLASCMVTSDIVSGQTVYTTKVSFNLIDSASDMRSILNELALYPFCLRIRDVYKSSYLVGIGKKPHPTIRFDYANEGSPTGKRLQTVEITYVNTFSTLQLA